MFKEYYVVVTTTKKVLYKSFASTPGEAIENIQKYPIGEPHKTFVETLHHGFKDYEVKERVLK